MCSTYTAGQDSYKVANMKWLTELPDRKITAYKKISVYDIYIYIYIYILLLANF